MDKKRPSEGKVSATKGQADVSKAPKRIPTWNVLEQ